MSVEQKSGDDLDKPIWGVEAIAAAANLTVRQAYHALESGYLPGSKAGRKWFTTPRRLLATVRTEVITAMQPTKRIRRGGEPRRMWSSELVIRRPAIGETCRMRNAITTWDKPSQA